MGKYQSRFFHSPLLAVLALGVSLLLPPLAKARYLAICKRAEAYAVKEYGDKKAPLTQEERTAWYNDLGIASNDRDLETSKLIEYLKDKPSFSSIGPFFDTRLY